MTARTQAASLPAAPTSALRLRSRKERPTVAHFVFPYLFRTGSWIHGQIQHLKTLRAVVITDRTENLNIFPCQSVHAYSDVSKARKLWIALRQRSRWELWRGFYESTLRRERPVLIHSHFGPTGAELLWLKHRLGLPMVTSFYGYDVTLTQRDPSWAPLYARLFDEGECFLVEGPHMKRALVKAGCPDHKVHVIRLGVDLEALPFRLRQPEPDGTIRVLVSATFCEKKGIPDALSAFERVSRAHPRLLLTVIGNARDEEPRDQAEKAKILPILARLGDTVSWRGFQPYPAFRAALSSHHIFLSPSRTASYGDTEGGSPVSITEATATGMPVVSTRHADIPQVIRHDENGLLSDEGDIDSIAANLGRLVANPDLWPDMGRRGRALVEAEFDVKAQARRLEDLYWTLIQ